MTEKLKTTPYRSKMMSKIRSTGGKAETILAKGIWHKGIRYFRNYKKLPGKPDIAITKYKIVVFVDGEFWHGYNWDEQKKNHIHRNRDYWIKKIEGNMERDKKQTEELKRNGWTVIRFWERHEVLKDPENCINKIVNAVNLKKQSKRR